MPIVKSSNDPRKQMFSINNNGGPMDNNPSGFNQENTTKTKDVTIKLIGNPSEDLTKQMVRITNVNNATPTNTPPTNGIESVRKKVF